MALKIVGDRSRGAVLTDRLVQDDPRPVSRRELGLADVGDRAGFRAADPHPVAYLKAVCVLGENDASICARSKRILFEKWQMCVRRGSTILRSSC